MFKGRISKPLRPLLLSAAILLPSGMAAPVLAQDDLRGVIGGIAESMLNQEMDRQSFRAAQSTNTIAAYRDYLQRYPRGIHAADAERALARLGDRSGADRDIRPTPNVPDRNNPVLGSPAQQEAGLRLGRTERVRVQQQLTFLGYNTGGSDGLWGRNTRSAISNWQGANKQTVTGYVTAQQLDLLNRQAGRDFNSGNNTNGRTDSTTPQLEENLLELTRSERVEIQQRLTRLGYNTRGADGAFGRNTRNALARWQGDMGESATGYITADQVRMLRDQRLR